MSAAHLQTATVARAQPPDDGNDGSVRAVLRRRRTWLNIAATRAGGMAPASRLSTLAEDGPLEADEVSSGAPAPPQATTAQAQAPAVGASSSSAVGLLWPLLQAARCCAAAALACCAAWYLASGFCMLQARRALRAAHYALEAPQELKGKVALVTGGSLGACVRGKAGATLQGGSQRVCPVCQPCADTSASAFPSANNAVGIGEATAKALARKGCLVVLWVSARGAAAG